MALFLDLITLVRLVALFMLHIQYEVESNF